MTIGLDEMVRLLSSLFAFILFFISVLAYVRARRRKLLLVSAAFFLFAVEAFLKVSDIFFPEKGNMIGVAANMLSFLVLILFFIAVIMRD